MSDRAAVALAVAVAAGAAVAWPVPLAAALAGVVAAFAVRRPAVLVAAGLFLACSLSARAWSGLEPPVAGARVAGTATVVTDPVRSRFGGVRVELRVGGRRVAATARGLPASRLVTRMAGERVRVEGRLRPLTGRAAPWLRSRHIAARLDVVSVGEQPDPGTLFDRVANHVRRLLDAGAGSMAPDHRALFAGFLLGDTRHQSPETVYDFRASGLSHLLAVSGQNVAFILAIAGPLLRRLRLPGRLAAGVVVLLLFATLTRWEPTVLRAVAMATVALVATTLGRPASSVRLLALAVAGLVLVDPLLVGSVAFQLSVSASAGIVLLSPALRHRLPGPRVVAEPAAVTIAAQAAVAPILVTAFDGVPVSSLPANLLAGPAAAPITVWGLVAGVTAGLAGEPAATILHLPTRLFIGWVAGVAAWAAALPLGDLGRREVAVAGALAVAAVVLPRRRRVAVAAICVVLAWAAFAPIRSEPKARSGAELTAGARLWTDANTTVLVIDRPDPDAVLSELRQANVRRVDLLVAASGSNAATDAVVAVGRRFPTRLVVTPGDHVAGTYLVGPIAVEVASVGARLEVTVRAGRT